jgi:hypothetical protein
LATVFFTAFFAAGFFAAGFFFAAAFLAVAIDEPPLHSWSEIALINAAPMVLGFCFRCKCFLGGIG